MALDLSTYRQIQVANFVKLDIPNYAVLRFCDYTTPYTLNGEYYATIGSLLSITDTYSELRASEQEVTVAVSGIPSGSVEEILTNNPKGASIEIRRAFFNVEGQFLNITGNPAMKFRGKVVNYSMDESWDSQTRTASHEILLQCSSLIGTLNNKVAGRKTNPYDEKKFFPDDLGMLRVPTIIRTNFNFGAPQK